MSLTYTTYVTTLANMAVTSAADGNFLQILPSCIDYAEGRCYRDLDLLSAVVRDQSAVLTVNSRNFTLPVPASGPFNIVDGMNVLVSGSRYPLTPASRDVIDMEWPSETASSSPSIPGKFAMVTDQTVIVGPPPSSAYTVEVVGKVNPTPLSASTTTTYLTSYLPDMFLVASMIFISGFQKNFGAQSDDPRMSQSWESQYQLILRGVDSNSARTKFAGASWTSDRPEPTAVPQRG